MRVEDPGPGLVEHLRRNALVVADGDAALDRDIRVHAARCERLLALIERLAPAPRGPRLGVLEVGLGSAYVTSALRWRFGADVDLYAVDHPARPAAAPETADYLAAQEVRFEPADLLAGPLAAFPGVRFDVVVLSEVIEHLPPPALPPVLSGLAGRLAGGGILVLSSPNLRSFHRRASLAVGSGRLFDLPLPQDDAGGTYGHLRLYGRAEIEELLVGAALEPVAWEYANWEAAFISSRGIAGALLRAGQALLPRLAPGLASGWIAAARARSR